MNKYIGINSINAVVDNIKNRFAAIQHIHDISEINGLQEKFDDLTPPLDIETSEDVIIRINQLTRSMNDLINTVNMLTPSIGELYLTVSDENPSVKFGGTWEQIKDVFLLSAGDNYIAGSIGGESEHVLTVDEMPKHSHLLAQDVITDNTSGEFLIGNASKWDHTFNVLIGSTEVEGGSLAHNNMPPYLAVYVWKRIA